jgi:hypothetical protein
MNKFFSRLHHLSSLFFKLKKKFEDSPLIFLIRKIIKNMLSPFVFFNRTKSLTVGVYGLLFRRIKLLPIPFRLAFARIQWKWRRFFFHSGKQEVRRDSKKDKNHFFHIYPPPSIVVTQFGGLHRLKLVPDCNITGRRIIILHFSMENSHKWVPFRPMLFMQRASSSGDSLKGVTHNSTSSPSINSTCVELCEKGSTPGRTTKIQQKLLFIDVFMVFLSFIFVYLFWVGKYFFFLLLSFDLIERSCGV